MTNPILEALDELREVLTAKQHDYAASDPFDNFRESAALADIDPEQSMLNLIGVKLSRIRNLRRDREPVNEPLLDSYKDHAGYAIILYAYAKQEAEKNSLGRMVGAVVGQGLSYPNGEPGTPIGKTEAAE